MYWLMNRHRRQASSHRGMQLRALALLLLCF
jgi:hypothetical protein